MLKSLISAAPFVHGARVELHPATNAWMMGDRYGTIEQTTRVRVYVKLDKSGLTLPVRPELLTVIEAAPL